MATGKNIKSHSAAAAATEVCWVGKTYILFYTHSHDSTHHTRLYRYIQQVGNVYLYVYFIFHNINLTLVDTLVFLYSEMTNTNSYKTLLKKKISVKY